MHPLVRDVTEEPRFPMKKFCVFVASGFGLGLVAPVAPGTFGSLPGVALAYATTALPVWLQLPVCTGLAILAIPFCDAAERALGIKDDGRSTLVRTDTATGAQKISIKNFAAGGGCTENLSDLMTNESKAGDRSRHTLLSRYDRDGVPDLHYLPLGDLLTAVAGVKVYGNELKMDEENKVDIKNLVKSLKANGESLEPDGYGVVDLGNLNTVTQNVLTVTGTAGSASGHRIRFASGDDSNIKVTVSNEGDEIVVKFDVYYK